MNFIERLLIKMSEKFDSTHADALTGLANRRYFDLELPNILANSRSMQSCGALIFIDLDYFKNINDTYGHKAGDIFLMEVARRLRKDLPATGIAVRWGGDEFVVILQNLGNIEAALLRAEALAENLLLSIKSPCYLDQKVYRGSASVGVYVFSGEETIFEVIDRADRAMYASKYAGKGTYRLYDKNMHDAQEERVLLTTELKRAIADHQFELYFQPQTDGAGNILGVEALLRWRHPNKGILSPLMFLPLAEDEGLISEIDAWILKSTHEVLVQWEAHKEKCNLCISINVSLHSLNQPQFLEGIEAITQTLKHPSNLVIEVTEGAVFIDESYHLLKRISSCGARVSLDDFGTGYFNIALLQRMSFHQLKIDGSFIRDVDTDEIDQVTVKTIIDIANNLKIHVIAERVEKMSQLEALKRLGCHTFQGNLFWKPLTKQELERLI